MKENIHLRDKPPKITDHRDLGRQAELWTHHPSSPGAPMFLPDGATIFSKIADYLRYQNRIRGFKEVLTPTMYKSDLWKTSGHWQHYKDDMFTLGDTSPDDQSPKPESERFGLKPMNCPAHCLLFDSQQYSYKDLPVRFSEIGTLHRNENSGSLSGLTRVRRFHTDDGHIFCTKAQAIAEVRKELRVLRKVYDHFHLTESDIRLSTRGSSFDTGYLGSKEDWDAASEILREALVEEGLEFSPVAGEAAFYGPKIDFSIAGYDGRLWQTSTIQLDLQLPKNFDLKYVAPPRGSESTVVQTNHLKPLVRETSREFMHRDRKRQEYLAAQDDSDIPEAPKPDELEGRPVVIHRAITGSIERFMALLADKYQRKWPFWLSPKQVIVLTVTTEPQIVEYAEKVQTILQDNRNPARRRGFEVDLDASAKSVARKIAKAKNAVGIRPNVIVIVGAKNLRGNNVDVDLSGQLMLKQSWDEIEKVQPGSQAPNQKDRGTGMHSRGLDGVRLEPKKLLTALRKWDQLFL